MFSSVTMQSLSFTLRSVPTAWVLWAVDEEGVFRVHEGPGADLAGLRSGDGVGRSFVEVYGDHPELKEFGRRVLRDHATEVLVLHGRRFRLSGGPVPGGGAAGLALAIEAAAAGDGQADEGADLRSVIELRRPVPEVAARAGDLLVLDPTTPGQVGLYRRLHVSELPAGVRDEVRSHRADACGDLPQARPRRPSYLRLVP